jgi:hypothetical protein
VKVSGLTVREGAIALTVRPLPAEERKAALENIRKPYATAKKSADAASAE